MGGRVVGHEVFCADNLAVVKQIVERVHPLVFLNCAGRHSKTLAQAAIESEAHYLDLSHNYDTVQELSSLSKAAERYGVVVMAAVGWNSVGSDLLASYLKDTVSQPTKLELVINTAGWSRSPSALLSLRTETAEKKTLMQIRDRNLTKLLADAPKFATVNFGADLGGQAKARIVRTGELFTVYWATGIPNITTAVSGEQEVAYLKAQPINSETGYEAHPCTVLGTISGATESRTARLMVQEAGGIGADITARLAVDIAGRLSLAHKLSGGAKPTPQNVGFRTATQLFGMDLLLPLAARITDMEENSIVLIAPDVASATSAVDQDSCAAAPRWPPETPRKTQKAPRMLFSSKGWQSTLCQEDMMVIELIVPWGLDNSECRTHWDAPEDNLEAVTQMMHRMVTLVVNKAVREHMGHATAYNAFKIGKHTATLNLKTFPRSGETANAHITVQNVQFQLAECKMEVLLRTEVSRLRPIDHVSEVAFTVTTEVVLSNSSTSVPNQAAVSEYARSQRRSTKRRTSTKE